MRVEVVRVRVRKRGFVSRRGSMLDAPVLRIGRSTDCEIHVTDPRVHLHQADLEVSAGGVRLTPRFPGAVVGADGPLYVPFGKTAQIGPYELRAGAPAPGAAASIELELVHPLGDDLEELLARSRLRLSDTGIDVRMWSLVLSALVLVLGVGFPAAALVRSGGHVDAMDAASLAIWSSGSLAGVHRHFGARCETCHADAFEPVRDEACTACHVDQPPHADPAAHPHATLSARCARCHEDHNPDLLTVNTDRFCVGCHGDPARHIPEFGGDPVSDFGDDHPELRATVVTGRDGTTSRVTLGDGVPRAQRSGLMFSHAAHLARDLPGPQGTENLACVDCHPRREGGTGISAPVMAAHCARCHPLVFDPAAPDRTVPHADAMLVQALVGDFYRASMTGAAVDGVPRRQPGDAAPADPADRDRWVDERVAEVHGVGFGRSVCAPCHEVEGVEGGWDVVPVRLQARYLVHGRFDHGRHRVEACTSCHAAAAGSESAGDLLLPGVSVCRTCHGGGSARDRVPSTCASCHHFHQRGSVAP